VAVWPAAGGAGFGVAAASGSAVRAIASSGAATRQADVRVPCAVADLGREMESFSEADFNGRPIWGEVKVSASVPEGARGLPFLLWGMRRDVALACSCAADGGGADSEGLRFRGLKDLGIQL
jgi:hypothetical protein